MCWIYTRAFSLETRQDCAQTSHILTTLFRGPDTQQTRTTICLFKHHSKYESQAALTSGKKSDTVRFNALKTLPSSFNTSAGSLPGALPRHFHSSLHPHTDARREDEEKLEDEEDLRLLYERYNTKPNNPRFTRIHITKNKRVRNKSRRGINCVGEETAVQINHHRGQSIEGF